MSSPQLRWSLFLLESPTNTVYALCLIKVFVSVQIPSLEGAQHTPLASYLGQTRVGMETVHHVQEEEDGDTDVTLRYNPPSALADGQGGGGSGSWGREEGGRNWINQPKLLLAESETIPPCPEKRSLQEGIGRNSYVNLFLPSSLWFILVFCGSLYSLPPTAQRTHECHTTMSRKTPLKRPHPFYRHAHLSLVAVTMAVVLCYD